jgi:hypothetical protein
MTDVSFLRLYASNAAVAETDEPCRVQTVHSLHDWFGRCTYGLPQSQQRTDAVSAVALVAQYPPKYARRKGAVSISTGGASTALGRDGADRPA